MSRISPLREVGRLAEVIEGRYDGDEHDVPEWRNWQTRGTQKSKSHFNMRFDREIRA